MCRWKVGNCSIYFVHYTVLQTCGVSYREKLMIDLHIAGLRHIKVTYPFRCIAFGVDMAFICICDFVCLFTPKGIWLELSTDRVCGTQHALSPRSKGRG